MASKNTKKPSREVVAEVPDEGADVAEELEEMLEGLPPLRPFSSMGLRRKNELTILTRRFQEVRDSGDFNGMLELCSDIDDFAADLAVDKGAYKAWIDEKDLEANQAVIAILVRYISAAGEAKRSTTS